MMHSNEKYYHAKYDQLMIMAPPQNFTAPPLATLSGTSQNRHCAGALRPCPGRYFVSPVGCRRAPAAGALRPCPGRYFVSPVGCGRAPMPLRLLVKCWCTVQFNQCPRAEPTSTVMWWWINFLFVASAPSPPFQSVGCCLWRKNGRIVCNDYLVLVYLINDNI